MILQTGTLLKKVVLCFTIIIISFSIAIASDEETSIKKFYGFGFIVTLPDNVRVERTKGPDFELYSFNLNSKTILRAFSGNFPNLINPSKLEKTSEINVNGLATKCTEWLDNNGIYIKECLIDLKIPFPNFVHFAHTNLPSNEKTLADSIIGSTILNTPSASFSPM